MYFEHRTSAIALAAHAALALCLSCSSSDPSEGDDAAAASGTETASSAAGLTGTTGTTATGTTGTAVAMGPATTGSVTTSVAASTTASQATTAGDGSGGTTGSDGSMGTGGNTNDAGITSGDVTGGTDSSTGGANTSATSTTGVAGNTGADPAPSAGCDSPAGLTSGPASIDVDGTMRDYILLVPDDYDPSHPYKLIFGWHPWGGSAEQTANMGYFGLEDVSGGQAILVAPEGQDYQGNGLGWANENGVDVDFYHAMRELFSAQLCIDQNRIFSTGFSFGAMFSFTLACTQDSMIRAIAPQAGNAMVAGCEDGDRSVATMAFIGTEDTLIDGHRQAVQTFVGRNGCSTEGVTLVASWCDGLDSMFEPCTCVEYPDCTAGHPVIDCEYNAGHQFAPDSGETIWNFFSQF